MPLRGEQPRTRCLPGRLRVSGLHVPMLLPCLLLLLSTHVSAQLPYPLAGQGSRAAPPNSLEGQPHLPIAVVALLERALGLDHNNNCYQAIWWIMLSWYDASAPATVEAATGLYLAGGNCTKPCDSSGLPSAGCCDGLWLPSVDTPNLLAYAEEQIPRYRIAVQPNGTVTWTTRVVGTWYAPFDFRAYPFDHQHLLLELSLADVEARRVGLAWEHVAKLNNTAHTKGPDLSGWRINWTKGKLYDSRTCLVRYNVTVPRYTLNSSSPRVAAYDPVLPGQRYYPLDTTSGSTSPDNCGERYQGPNAVYSTRLAGVYGSVPHRYWEANGALYGPVVLVADVMVKRASSPFVLSNLLPTIIISLVVYIVFFLPCDALGERMTVIMTAFLSITALQFMFDTPPAVYMNALQQAVLLSYVMYLVAAVESLVVHRIVTVSGALSNKRQCVSKYGGLLNTARRSALSARLRTAGSLGKQAGETRSAELPPPRPRGTRVRRASVTSVASHHSCTQQPPHLALHAAAQAECAGHEGRDGPPARAMRRVPSRREKQRQHRQSAGSSGSAAGAHGNTNGGPVGDANTPAVAGARGHAAGAQPVGSWDAAGGGNTHMDASGHQVGVVGRTYSLSVPSGLAPAGVQQYPPPPAAWTALTPAAAPADLSPAAAGPVSPVPSVPSYGTPFGRRAESERQQHPPAVVPPPLLPISYPPMPPPCTSLPSAPGRGPTAPAQHSGPDAGDPAKVPLVHPLTLNSSVADTPEESGPDAPAAGAATGPGSRPRATTAGAHYPEGYPPPPTPGFGAAAAAADDPDVDANPHTAQAGDGDTTGRHPTSRWGRLMRRCCRTEVSCCTGSPWGCHRSSFWWLWLMLAWEWIKSVVRAPRVFYAQCKADEAFGLFVARRIDFWCCLILFLLYAVAFAVLMYVGVLVGDHRLMLGDRPGNM